LNFAWLSVQASGTNEQDEPRKTRGSGGFRLLHRRDNPRDHRAINGLPATAMSGDERATCLLRIYHQLIFPTDTVAVRPATRRRSGGTSSSLIRTGMRCAKRTQLKVGLTKANNSLLVVRF
jgi:hypothetical protein